ncbi:CRISPR-associated endonuclease Cas2 [Myxacorys almedinensis A]|uniref:CRISPR-associated endoribonuclease Cas2 n=2 Tax=Myxacorys TaxID=2056239 RepID=A0A8J8CIL5_9CYAN|nr:CRISPR-associated endonuclease Cas2 [Myxacorys almedinensis A]
MLLYLVTYDVPCNARRKKVADLLEGYGRRVQYSVFECVLPVVKYEELRQRMRQRVNLQEDSIRFYPISGHTLRQVETWGGVPITQVPGSIVV